MARNRLKAGKREPGRIDLSQGYDVEHWCRVLRCTERQLRDAAQAVGPKIEDMRRHLRR